MNNNHLLDVLTRQGVLISVNIRYWRAQKKLTAQDIGIDPDVTRLIILGHKRLLPRESLAPFTVIESSDADLRMKPGIWRRAIRQRSSSASVSSGFASSAPPPEGT